jgi:hypothetical protein
MHRRQFILSSASALALTGPIVSSPAHAVMYDTPIDAVAAIKALRLTAGPFAGGYEVAPNGKLNWYFTALGLLPIVQLLSPADLDTYIRTYLDLYIRNLTPQSTIADIDFRWGRADPYTFTRQPSDSDDSYAATFLSLAARYVRASNNMTWWNANKATLLNVAYRNIATQMKRNGLTSVFQPPRSQANSIGYLMDNCEVYRGLRDFAEILAATGNSAEAAYYNQHATGVATGLDKLFHSGSSAFMPGDAYAGCENSFYPGTTCQVFPQAFGVKELAPRFNSAWNYLNAHSSGWADGRFDDYPWAVLGFVAAKRGQTALVHTQMNQMQFKFATRRALVTINELGFYQRTLNVLAGRADV